MNYRYVKNNLIVVAATIGIAFSGSANATIKTVFDNQDAGAAAFDNTVKNAGTSSSVVALADGVSAYSDFTLNETPSGGYSSGSSSITGSVIGIDPAGPDVVPRSNPLDYKASGFSITFTGAVNSVGFDVGDWGTCCQPSSLYISFDSGAPIKVGESDVSGDVYLTNGDPIVFVGAFDDSSSFKTVNFWGDGVGEYLVAGGTLRYALLDTGSLPPPTSAVPESATWLMMILGFGAIGGMMRRVHRKSEEKFTRQVRSLATA